MNLKAFGKNLITLIMVILVLFSTLTTHVNLALAGENSTSDVQNSSDTVKELVFSDTEDFYKQLATLLQSKQAVNIITPYTNYSEFPPRIKQIFKPDTSKSIATPAVAAIAPNSAFSITQAIPAQLDLNALFFTLYTVGGAGMGAAIGTFFGGIGAVPGALIGAGMGLAAGTINAALADSCREVVFVFDVIKGQLIIKTTWSC